MNHTLLWCRCRCWKAENKKQELNGETGLVHIRFIRWIIQKVYPPDRSKDGAGRTRLLKPVKLSPFTFGTFLAIQTFFNTKKASSSDDAFLRRNG